MKNKHTTKKSNGFALFYAVLVSSLVLSIGIATFNLSFKGGRLAAGAVNSQAAFYAADTGMECALYWDIQQGVFSGIASNPIIECNGGERITTETVVDNLWRFSLTQAGGIHCATVEVDKRGEGTIIKSRGYNTCNTASDRRVERGMRATY